jgi:hypothetical protein
LAGGHRKTTLQRLASSTAHLLRRYLLGEALREAMALLLHNHTLLHMRYVVVSVSL